MRFMRTVGYTRCDHKRNEEILKHLKIDPKQSYIQLQRQNWLNHINGTEITASQDKSYVMHLGVIDL